MSRSADPGGASRTGNPKFPARDGCSLSIPKENTMFTTPVTQTSQPVAVLLGGSGYARPATRIPAVPALLKPPQIIPGRSGSASEPHAMGA